jgi:hypothetical protein
VVKHGERDNRGKQAVAIRHSGSVSVLHMDIRTAQTMAKGTHKRGIDLKALDILDAISQAIRGHAGARTNFQY